MVVYNQDKTEVLTEYDLEKGYIKEDHLEKIIPAQKAIEEKYHYEIVAEYPNGGKDVTKVIDVEKQEAVEEHIEYEPIQIYIPYTERELAQQEIQKLKIKLQQTDYQAIKYAEGFISEEEYAPIRAQRQAWREEINQLELI